MCEASRLLDHLLRARQVTGPQAARGCFARQARGELCGVHRGGSAPQATTSLSAAVRGPPCCAYFVTLAVTRFCAHPFTLADFEPASMALRHMVFLENCVSSRMATWHLPSGLFQSPCSQTTVREVLHTSTAK